MKFNTSPGFKFAVAFFGLRNDRVCLDVRVEVLARDEAHAKDTAIRVLVGDEYIGFKSADKMTMTAMRVWA